VDHASEKRKRAAGPSASLSQVSAQRTGSNLGHQAECRSAHNPPQFTSVGTIHLTIPGIQKPELKIPVLEINVCVKK
jgi:hypothetical protein